MLWARRIIFHQKLCNRVKKVRFLIGVFKENARLLQWLVFFRQFNAIGPLFLFICSPEVIKIVLPKVLQNFKKTPNCTCWPKELKYKGFPRNIQYRTRLEGPPFVFWAFRDFFGKKIPKGPLQFFGVVRPNGC